MRNNVRLFGFLIHYCMAEEVKDKDHTKTAPEFAVKNIQFLMFKQHHNQIG